MNSLPPDLIGSADAARLLGKSPRTVHRMVTAGILNPAMTAPGGFKGAYLFNRADVEALSTEREPAA
jgi:Helix-turn-helix domain